MNKVICPICQSDNVEKVVIPIWCSTYTETKYTCQKCGAKFTPELLQKRKNRYCINFDWWRYFYGGCGDRKGNGW